jgi:hypothetical protein
MVARKILVAGTMAGVLLFAGAALAEVNMQDGQWEMSIKVDMPGMPPNMPASKFTQCLTKKDVVPVKKEPSENCKMVKNSISGNTVTWVMECRNKDGGTTESAGSVTYKGAGFDGGVKTVITNAQGKKMEMKSLLSGRRVGECSK